MITQLQVSKCCHSPVRAKQTVKRGEQHICRACHYECDTFSLITAANIQPAYGRRPHSLAQTLDLFYRGLDFQFDSGPPYTSVRDFAQGAQVQLRFGKRLQKVAMHTVDHNLKTVRS